jgi:ATP-dependent Zn protease
MIVRHRKAVDEDVRGSRSRQIKAIFLEQGGERFRFPHNHLAGARAMARHMYEGGNMQDTIGEYIVESVSNMIKLNEFVRYARTNKLMNEASEDVVKTVKENINTLRNELKGLTGAKSYAKVSEAIAAREATVLEEDDTTDLQRHVYGT